jgi:hypothetical protein
VPEANAPQIFVDNWLISSEDSQRVTRGPADTETDRIDNPATQRVQPSAT